MGLNDKRMLYIAGGDFTDIVLYLVRILVCLGKKTIIFDHSFGHRLYPSIPHIEGIEPVEEIIDYRGVGYTFGTGEKKESREEIREADVIIKIFEINKFLPEDEPCLIISDESRGYLELLETMRLGERSMVIVRNYTGAIKRRLEKTAEVSCKGNVFCLPVSSDDIKNGIRAQYNDVYTFTGISERLKKLLVEITGFIFPDIDVKKIRKAYQAAEKGKNG